MSHDVFISYSSYDKPTADAACAMLESNGLRCWMAPRDILPGMDWGEAIVDAISESRVFLLIFSARANESGQIKREVERAVNRGMPVIPLRIEDVAPTRSLEYFISTPHWLDAFTLPLQQHLEYLVKVINALLKTKPVKIMPSGLGTPPAGSVVTAPNARNIKVWVSGGVFAAALVLSGVWFWIVRKPVAATPAAITRAEPSPPAGPDPKLAAALKGSWSPEGISCANPLQLSIKDGSLFIRWSGKTSTARVLTKDSGGSSILTHAEDGDYTYTPDGNVLTVTDPGGNIVRMTRCAG